MFRSLKRPTDPPTHWSIVALLVLANATIIYCYGTGIWTRNVWEIVLRR